MSDKKKKRTASRQVQDHIWNISVLWEFLRRTKTYPVAVEKFLVEASKCGDYANLENYESYRKPYVASADEQTRFDFPHEAGVEMQKPIEHRVDFKMPSLNTEEVLYDSSEDSLLTSSHGRQFIAQFGDIIRFPYPPDAVGDLDHLSELWVLTPVGVLGNSEAVYQQEIHKFIPRMRSRVSVFQVAVNWNCSDASIHRFFSAISDKIIKERNMAPSLRDFKTDRQAAKRSLKAFDLHVKGASLSEIGKALWSHPGPARPAQLAPEGQRWLRAAKDIIACLERPETSPEN